MDNYRAKSVLEYTKQLDDVKGTASSVAIDAAIQALDMQEKLKVWIDRYKLTQEEYGNDKIFSREKLISILEEFLVS